MPQRGRVLHPWGVLVFVVRPGTGRSILPKCRMSPARKNAASDSFNEIATIRIALQGTDPPIWRQVEVPTSVTLKLLHDIIQGVMGWSDYHLWEFTIGKQKYGLSSDADWGTAPSIKASTVHLRDVLKLPKTVIKYTYDFGDCWEHRLTVTDIRASEPGVSYPRYIGGERKAPPEDCGGMPGFYQMLEAVADPKNKQWADDYDPNAIDELSIKHALIRIAKPTKKKPPKLRLTP